jgi:drug/metabolite transporter (DMT)-like permease
MPELSLYNIDQISNDVRKQEITFSHLLDELIDHLCCDVEQEMQNGLDFSEAYRKVKQKMGSGRRFKEIQEETLYVVDTKYRYMKNTMKISGIAGTVLLGFAALFKIQHWPLAGVMITLGALILAFVFVPSALGVLWKETHSTKRLFLFISASLAGILFILGTLFKVQHWPLSGFILALAALFVILFFVPALLVSKLQDQENKSKKPVYILGAIGLICYTGGMLCKIQHWPFAGLLMVLGLIIFGCVAFPLYTWFAWKEENHISSKFLYVIIGMLLIIVPGALINLNLQRSYEDGFYSHQKQQQALYGYLNSNNNSLLARYHDSLSYPQMEQLHAKTKSLLALVGDIQTKIVQQSEGEPGKPALSQDQISQTETGIEIQYEKLSRPFNPYPVWNFLAPGSNPREGLNTALKEYAKYISGLVPGEDLQTITGLLEPSRYLPEAMPDDINISLMSGLHSLELLKNSLLTVESNALMVVAKHK